ncbi:MAG: hypothetical protein IJY81_06575 [Lachnospiraceae bacterium]|nr:hypothetical protein [Lachnospiraceae bacterium]
MNKQKTKCDFCRYTTFSGCMVTPDSYYCKEAIHEYYQYLQNKKIAPTVQKSLRPWDKK